MTEMGRKNLDVPFDADDVCEQILRDYRTWRLENLPREQRNSGYDPQRSQSARPIASLGKNQYLLFELGLIEPQEKAAWLVERYGFEINFASVSPADVVAVDAIRRGMHRKSHYSFMAGRSA